MKFQTQSNLNKPKGEINNLPSLTIPDQALSVSEILDRHTRGLGVPQKTPTYSNIYTPEIESLDLTEQAEMMNDQAQIIHEIRLEQQEQARKKHEAQLFEEYEKRKGETVESPENGPSVNTPT